MQAQTSTDQTAEVKPLTNSTKANVKKHSPKKATLLSLFIPGAGQVYNKKNWWWKVPVIYGIGGTLLYSGIFYQNEYDNFRLAYKERIETLTNKDQIYNRYQTPTLQVIRDSYRDSRDQSYMWLVVVYALQVLDATVEAHFVDFNMNENVSLKIQPQIYMVGLNYTGGLQVTFKF
jgi:Family of unknown function (DUF5683)